MGCSANFQRIAAVFVVASVFCLGCGGDGIGRTAVHGKVAYDGVPVEDGQITFTPESGQSSGMASGQIRDGEYRIAPETGPMAGRHAVSIRATRKTGKQTEAAMPAPPGTMIDEVVEYIPYKYNFQTSLTANLEAGDDNEVDYILDK